MRAKPQVTAVVSSNNDVCIQNLDMLASWNNCISIFQVTILLQINDATQKKTDTRIFTSSKRVVWRIYNEFVRLWRSHGSTTLNYRSYVSPSCVWPGHWLGQGICCYETWNTSTTLLWNLWHCWINVHQIHQSWWS